MFVLIPKGFNIFVLRILALFVCLTFGCHFLHRRILNHNSGCCSKTLELMLELSEVIFGSLWILRSVPHCCLSFSLSFFLVVFAFIFHACFHSRSRYFFLFNKKCDSDSAQEAEVIESRRSVLVKHERMLNFLCACTVFALTCGCHGCQKYCKCFLSFSTNFCSVPKHTPT